MYGECACMLHALVKLMLIDQEVLQLCVQILSSSYKLDKQMSFYFSIKISVLLGNNL